MPPAVPEHLWNQQSASWHSDDHDGVDGDVRQLLESHVGRMRLRLRAKEARAQGSQAQRRNAEVIEVALAHQATQVPCALWPPGYHQTVIGLIGPPTIPPLPTLTDADMQSLGTVLPVPPLYPPGHSGLQPVEWHEEDQTALDAWIAAGRPDVVVQGLPIPGMVYHPWVTFTGHWTQPGDRPTTHDPSTRERACSRSLTTPPHAL